MSNCYNILANSSFKLSVISDQDINSIVMLYKASGRQVIYEYAKNKKILPFIAVLLSRLNIDKDYWCEIAAKYRKRNNDVIANLDTLFIKLAECRVHKIFVTENFGALLSADADKALFASGDVDMYADPRQKESVYNAFNQLGYHREERYSHKKLINTYFHNYTVFPDGFQFCIAWHPLSRMKLPSFINADDFVDWNKLRVYKETAIILPDVDALLYICLLHISLHSFSRAPDIRLYIDVVNALVPPVSWEKIITFAKRDKTMVRLLTACILTNKLIAADIPKSVLRFKKDYERQINCLLRLVYDKNFNCLIYEPSGLKSLIIELLSDDRGLSAGLLNMLFPDKKWIREFYLGSKGNILAGYAKHLRNLM